MPRKNSVKLIEGRKDHWYACGDGVERPSVTTILKVINKPALVNWASNTQKALDIEAAADLYLDLINTKPMTRMAYTDSLKRRIGAVKAHQKKLDEAGEIGSQAHALIEWTTRKMIGQDPGKEPAVSPKALIAYNSWTEWRDKVELKPLYVEQKIYSEKHGYAGTLDLIAEVEGKVTLVDYKTSKAIYPESFLQISAYSKAVEEMIGLKTEQGMIVRLPKRGVDPEFETRVTPPADELFPTFLHILEVWKWWTQNK